MEEKLMEDIVITLSSSSRAEKKAHPRERVRAFEKHGRMLNKGRSKAVCLHSLTCFGA